MMTKIKNAWLLLTNKDAAALAQCSAMILKSLLEQKPKAGTFTITKTDGTKREVNFTLFVEEATNDTR